MYYVCEELYVPLQQSYTNQVKTTHQPRAAKPRRYAGHMICQGEVRNLCYTLIFRHILAVGY